MAAKPYVFLRRALERNARVAVAKFAWHNRKRLGLLSVRDDVLILHSMKWPDEVRDSSEPAPDGIDLDKDEISAGHRTDGRRCRATAHGSDLLEPDAPSLGFRKTCHNSKKSCTHARVARRVSVWMRRGRTASLRQMLL
ncbi:Ku protein [Streptomyces sp. NBC_01800]|uniref:Ku protein n=1 Tax=Streptomyces sp. NBC_01800 TaxID=2975945 RepID=UPI003FA3A9C0